MLYINISIYINIQVYNFIIYNNYRLMSLYIFRIMPRYCSCIDFGNERKAYVFDYNEIGSNRQIITMSSCIYNNGRYSIQQLNPNNPKTQLKQDQEFQGFIIKTKNAPYDYSIKIWNVGRVIISDY